MSQESITPSYGLSAEEEAELLGGVRAAMNMDYGVSPDALPVTRPLEPVSLEETAERERRYHAANDRQDALRRGLEEPDYLAGKISLDDAADRALARDAARYEAALATATLPYDGVTPGLSKINAQKLQERGGVWAQDL
jgi:hypothetical protein